MDVKKIAVLNSKAIASLLLIACLHLHGQVLNTFTPYRNVAYASTGINNSFANTSIGIARIDYLKIIHRPIIGLLDISLPVTNKDFTRTSVRKGLQIDVVNLGDFKVPFSIASSSIIRKNRFYKIHDLTLEFAATPTFKSGIFYFGLDLRCEFILFRHFHYFQNYLDEVNPKVKNHWEDPDNVIGKAGIIIGVDMKSWFLQLRCGYEKYPSVIHQLIPAYAVIGGGIKFGTKRPLPTW